MFSNIDYFNIDVFFEHRPSLQSRAIGRYIAKKGNLYGSNDLEALEIDATIDSMDDIRQGKNADD